MPEYSIRAKVNQIVTKEVQLLVVARSEEEALNKSREALQTYPEEVTVPGVKRMVTQKSKYWIPRDIEFTESKEEKDIA